VIVLLACVCVGVFLLFRSKPSGFIPQEDEGRLYITYELPEASSTTRSIATLNKIMQIIAETKGIRHYAALGGLNAITFATKANSGTIFTSLNPWDERKDKDLQLKGITATLQKKFAAIKEANILVIAPPAIPGLGQTGGFTFEFQQKGSLMTSRLLKKMFLHLLPQ
jgi:HAE1 family hydrophobic/amphiphilic exporter-1